MTPRILASHHRGNHHGHRFVFAAGRDATRVGAIVFSEEVRLVFQLDTYFDSRRIKQELLNLEYLGGRTNTPGAIIKARQECFNPQRGDRPEVQNVVVIVTDGVPHPNRRRAQTIAQAQVMRAEGTRMVAVGITNIIDRALLKELSSPPQVEDENYFTSTDFTVLGEISMRVGQSSCVEPTPREYREKTKSLAIGTFKIILDDLPVLHAFSGLRQR